jgi:hypothetical protein
MLRKALAGGVDSGESSVEQDRAESTPTRVPHRFEHYELMTSSNTAEDSKLELRSGEFVVSRPAVVPAYGPRRPETYGITEQGRDYVMKQRANKRPESKG